MLGICTRYCYHEATQVAIRIAEWQQQRAGDYEVTVFPTTDNNCIIDDYWDKEIKRNKSQLFTEWVQRCKTVLWTHVPTKEQLEWCKRRKITTLIYPLWHEISNKDRPALRNADWVLSPNTALSRLLGAKYNLRRCLVAPYDPGLPLTIKDERVKSSNVWVLFPMYDRESFKMEATSMEIAGRLLAARDEVVLTVLYTPSTMSSSAKKRMSQFRKYFGERFRTYKSLSMRQRPLLFRDHDITMWPVHYDSLGLTPLTSMAMGTPVVTFAVSPLTEITNKFNSVSVPCKGYYNRIGVPHVEPDYTLYERCLQNAVINRDYLSSLQQTVLTGLPVRGKVFNEVMGRVIC